MHGTLSVIILPTLLNGLSVVYITEHTSLELFLSYLLLLPVFSLLSLNRMKLGQSIVSLGATVISYVLGMIRRYLCSDKVLNLRGSNTIKILVPSSNIASARIPHELTIKEASELMLDKVAHRDFYLLNTVHISRYILFFFIFESRLHLMVDIIRYAEAYLAHVIFRLSGQFLDKLIVS